ncbi:MAG TPA: (2Fe-2S)-binding protein [Acidobacteriaceae bacterium]
MATDDRDQTKTQPGFEPLTRRSFLGRAGAVGVATAAATIAVPGAVASAPQTDPIASEGQAVPGTVAVKLRVNGEVHQLRIDPRATVLDTLRESLFLTGTKKGCDHGQCGACTVHVNGRRVNSCLLLAAMQQNAEIATIEGMGTPDQMHPMQASFVEHDAFQCGYCTSGQVMSAVALLKEPCGPKDTDVKEAMSGNICRCGAYPNIVAAVQAVRRSA